MSQSLSGTALVTGASRGIGAAIAVALARAGARVVGTATTETGLEAFHAVLHAAGHDGHGYMLDVADPASLSALEEALASAALVPSIVVNNAGITRDNLVLRMSDAEWSSVIDTDLSSVFRVSRAFLRSMLKARWGRIINITSVVGSTGNPGQCNYAAAKAGIAGFTRALAREVGARGITVNCVAPGFIDTDMTRELPEATRGALLQQIPLGRLGRPEDIAAAVVFLAGESGAYITGATLHVNGGMFMD